MSAEWARARVWERAAWALARMLAESAPMWVLACRYTTASVTVAGTGATTIIIAAAGSRAQPDGDLRQAGNYCGLRNLLYAN